jgi:hypothetical protein
MNVRLPYAWGCDVNFDCLAEWLSEHHSELLID